MTSELYYEAKRNALPYAAERGHNRTSIEDIDIEHMKTAHIIGVCGTAMASLASLLIERGMTVSGSDQACYPPMSTVLEDLHVQVLPFDVKNIEGKDLIIVGNMCSPVNVEAAYCRDNNIPYFSLGEIIGKLCIGDKKSIVVAGTHGKTTTTSVAISAFKYASLNPAYLVGGVMKEDGKSAHYNPDSKYFIIEGDEYDTAYFDKRPKFLHYKPYVTIITSLELDHIDIYKDFADYEQAFKYLIEATHKDGVVIACVDDNNVKILVEKMKDTGAHIITYGKDFDADMKIVAIETVTEGQKVTVEYKGKQDTFTTHMFGEYNALNTVAIYTAATFLNLDIEKIKESFTTFEGVKRRQEIYGVKNNVTIIDDFAHHPTAVFKTLKGLRERFPTSNIRAIFEPRTNTSRAKIFEEEYAHAFSFTNQVYISTPKKKDGYNSDEFMDVEYVAKTISEQGIPCKAFSDADEIVAYIKNEIQSGDILVVMSNGDFHGIHAKLLNIL
ncbi:MAG: Mur ligase family protein [Patescibacteria group bacterium]